MSVASTSASDPISPLAIRRITVETKNVMELPPSDGIYWIPDEHILTRGIAVVCGCEGTPYYGGAFSFNVEFPPDYPFKPPSFKFLTQDGKTRFNPNLYTNGKVCLSILNTWQGEQWTAVQTLLSVLQCIQSNVLGENPLVNEPTHPASRDSKSKEIPIYNRMILHATVATAVLDQLTKPPKYLLPVYEQTTAWSKKAIPKLIEQLTALAATYDDVTEAVHMYNMSVKYSFGALVKKLSQIVLTP